MKTIWHRYKEIILYLIFGVLTTVVGYGSYVVLTRIFLIETMLANASSFIIAVCFAYLTNRHWVFTSHACTVKEKTREAAEFFSARLIGFVLDMTMMFVGVELLSLNDLVMKAAVNVTVVVLNYIASKYIIFNPKRRNIT